MEFEASLDSTQPPRKWFRPGGSSLRRLGLADDGGDRHGSGLALLGRRGYGLPLVPRVPLLARNPLLLGRQLGPVLIADEPRSRTPRAVGAAFHPAAHVERAASARRLRRQADDALGRHRRRQLALGGQTAVALQDALLLARGKLARVLTAEPAVARTGPGLAAAGHRP